MTKAFPSSWQEISNFYRHSSYFFLAKRQMTPPIYFPFCICLPLHSSWSRGMSSASPSLNNSVLNVKFNVKKQPLLSSGSLFYKIEAWPFHSKGTETLGFFCSFAGSPPHYRLFLRLLLSRQRRKKSYCLRPRRTSALHRCPATAVSSSGYIFSLCLLTTLPFW